ncbi:GGDEF domain-containing protein [Alkalimarinus sediminis]|uniref:diguanylate cyclase n=1 Tax=Alkalimarinus sediminis TaxID=1632866 RepID=A0A9E8KP23_9ALTE|nr:GGDEF domain-containing protein [Alkalimarinus sediminis]UZW74978.1 GGDEF domain-containing protein [Alkalimarinus sediminis]
MVKLKTLLREYSNPLEWSAGTKAALLLCFTLIVHTQYFLWAYYQLSPYAPETNQHYVNLDFINEYKTHLNCILMLSISFFGLVLWLRKRYPDSEFHEYLATQYFALTLLYGAYAIGTLSIATGVVIAGAPVVGFILFNRRAVILAFVISLAGHWLISYGTTFGDMPYAPVVQNIQEADGSLSHFWLETMYYFTAPHLIVLTVFAYHVLSRWRQREDEIRQLSLTDPLTQLSNRRSILSSLAREHERSRRHGISFSLLLVDLDHFKKINDTWGHPAGDQVLIETAKVLKASVRQNDYVGRYGGEEFLVVLPDTDFEGAHHLAERCRQHLEGLTIDITGSPSLNITGSIGLFCNMDDYSVSAEQMLHYADEALYKAKKSGRNCIVRYNEASETQSST